MKEGDIIYKRVEAIRYVFRDVYEIIEIVETRDSPIYRLRDPGSEEIVLLAQEDIDEGYVVIGHCKKDL